MSQSETQTDPVWFRARIRYLESLLGMESPAPVGSTPPRVYAVVRFQIDALTAAELDTVREDIETENLFAFIRTRIGGPDSQGEDPSLYPWFIERIEAAP